jgi:signal transduction histidine kinase
MGILRKKALFLGLITGGVGLAISLLPFGLEMEERIGLAWLFQLRGERQTPEEVVIVSLDKESIDLLHLPDNISKWPRSTHANLVSKLTHEKAAVVAFDLSFNDPSEEDPLFAEAIATAGNVVLIEKIERDNDLNAPLIEIQKVIPLVSTLAREAAALAIFPLPKTPVQISQYWRFKNNSPYLATLPVVVFKIFSPALYQKNVDLYGNKASDYLNFYGPPQTITTVPYFKVLQLPKPVIVNGKAVSFNRKAVFIGLSEKTPDRQKDGFHTVYSQPDGLDLSGVEIAATAFANLLEDRPIDPLPFWTWLLIVLLWGMFIGTLASSLSLVHAIGVSIVLPLVYIGTAFLQFNRIDTWLPLVIPILFQTPLALFGALMFHYLKAREMDRRKSEAVAHLAHEIRTPLAATKGYLDNLRDKIVGDLTEKQQNYISRMLMNMDALNRMVQDQLNLSQIESGKMRVSLVPLSLYDLLSERVEAMRPIFTRKQIQVLLNPFEGATVVLGDQDKLAQVFTNLLDNAIKFTPSGGAITVTCRQAGKWLETSIRDTGIGIPIKEQARIFDRLHQVQTGQPKQGKGAGLGLFIVKQLVELQAGTIRVQSLPGQGSEFIVALPRSVS